MCRALKGYFFCSQIISLCLVKKTKRRRKESTKQARPHTLETCASLTLPETDPFGTCFRTLLGLGSRLEAPGLKDAFLVSPFSSLWVPLDTQSVQLRVILRGHSILSTLISHQCSDIKWWEEPRAFLSLNLANVGRHFTLPFFLD